MVQGIPFPQIDPVAFRLGFIVIRWYALAYIVGLLLAWGLARKMSLKAKSVVTVLKLDDFLVWAIAGIILGGRLGYILFYNMKYYLEFPLQTLFLWQGGMSFHGGLIGMMVATFLFARKKQVPVLALGDIICCVAPIGLFLGRLANFVNAELYGRVTTQTPWAVIFPGQTLPRHPSQIYEALCEGLVLFCILNGFWWFSKKYRQRTGFFTGLFFLLYGLMRFGLEFFREPDAHLGFVLGKLSMGQILCLPMIIGGIYLIRNTTTKVQFKRLIKGKKDD